MRVLDLSKPLPSDLSAEAVLIYTTVDATLDGVLSQFAARGIRVFGTTSFKGVFTPRGFARGAWGLVWEKSDGVKIAHALVQTAAADAQRDVENAARALEATLGAKPEAVLVHATPGFEERVIEGLAGAGWHKGVPVFGGSAADDDLSGSWRIFDNDASLGEGVLIAALVSERPVYGAFVSGYFGTKRAGRITRCEGRTVHTIEHRPAAEVLDEWMDGALKNARVDGGVVLAETTLCPIGRVIDRTHNVPRYLLSHPHLVHADTQSVSFFTEFAEGDEIEVMMGSRDSLLDRTGQVVRRALRRAERPTLMGGVLIYCGGCVGAIENDVDDVTQIYSKELNGAPFLGAATFGEIGTFSVDRELVVRHGNLMCDTLLFGR